MGKVVIRPNEQTATITNRNRLHATNRAASPVAPGDETFQIIARAQGSTLVALTTPPETVSTTVSLGTGLVHLAALWVPSSAVAGSVIYGLSTVGATLVSSGGFNGSVIYAYDDNAGSPRLKLLDNSTSTLNWFNSTQTNDTIVKIPLAKSFTIGRGLYYVGVMINFSSGTAPQMYCTAGTSAAVTNLGTLLPAGRSVRFSSTSSSPPSTIAASGLTNNSNLRMFGLLNS